ncbi:MAG: Metal-dependent hydrolases of the beta-lactamase superfamily I, partial [uncultured Ramlibacter sp.]
DPVQKPGQRKHRQRHRRAVARRWRHHPPADRLRARHPHPRQAAGPGWHAGRPDRRHLRHARARRPHRLRPRAGDPRAHPGLDERRHLARFGPARLRRAAAHRQRLHRRRDRLDAGAALHRAARCARAAAADLQRRRRHAGCADRPGTRHAARDRPACGQRHPAARMQPRRDAAGSRALPAVPEAPRGRCVGPPVQPGRGSDRAGDPRPRIAAGRGRAPERTEQPARTGARGAGRRAGHRGRDPRGRRPERQRLAQRL